MVGLYSYSLRDTYKDLQRSVKVSVTGRRYRQAGPLGCWECVLIKTAMATEEWVKRAIENSKTYEELPPRVRTVLPVAEWKAKYD